MRKKTTIINRALSPHLSIYNPQVTSLSSIWHRISGVLLLVIIVSFNIITKLGSFLIFYIPILHMGPRIILFIYLISLVLFLYHSFNGVRHIGWNFTYGFKPSSLYNSFYIICICVICIIISNLI
uniref:succinate:cytochrome c oxidoreductase subunit 3 n=1 Tax=Hypnea cervicornis TaxID=387623 RepID=UPI0021B61030|nr:succinate:cytochrome c oxidoreductase subunit 3 [Hypnea cervicornis]UVW80594.1 succinate:cytochrome c oxidoreductase subunit 3 [Hypnea cervicornis]